MTLPELLPSIGLSGEPPLEPGLWPSSTRIADGGELVVGGVPLTHVAAQFGTPCQILDETEVRSRARAFRHALPGTEVIFAGKALPARSVYRWMDEEGLSLDVCSAGELAVARSVDFPASRILLHGNVKTPDDLKAAFSYGVGRIVADSFDELDAVAALAPPGQAVLIRVTPGVDAGTHPGITTGVEDQKFGFSLSSGAATDAAGRVLAESGLHFAGLHCHIGSQVRRVAAYEAAASAMVGLIAELRDWYGAEVTQLNLGGGFAVPYLPGESSFDLPGLAHRLCGTLARECAIHNVPIPSLALEPGRSLVATAGLTLYRVITVKHDTRTFVAVDGGMSDNPRPALYGSRYTARLVGRHTPAPRRPMTVVGRHCEAGDVIASDVPLPADLHPGDLLAVPVTGAYHHALASNYNLVCRPPVIALRNSTPHLLIRRETETDLLHRDLAP